MKLSQDFIGLASCVVGSGASVSLWGDVWNFGLLKLEFPQLFSFARNQNISVAAFLSRSVKDNFHLPLSSKASK